MEHFRKSRDSSLSQKCLPDEDSNGSRVDTRHSVLGGKERERERLSQKENGIEGEPERGHFVCLVPRGDTRCMGATVRIIANARTPLSNLRGEQRVSPR